MARSRGGAEVARRSAIKVGQFGWFAKGTLYVVAGALAATVAAKSWGWRSSAGLNGEASPTGAIKQVAGLAGGRVLLFALAAGMIVYSIWRLFTAFGPGGHGAEAVAKRIGYVVSAILYVSFGLTAFALARRPGANPDGNAKVSDLTSRVLAHTAGRVIISLFGLIAIGAGLYRLKKGVSGDVEEELDLSRLSSAERSKLHLLGVVGEVGRGLAIGLIGFFLLSAGIQARAGEATGLDGALRRLAQHRWGTMLVTVVAVGFVAYGVFCLLTFRRRQLRAPS